MGVGPKKALSHLGRGIQWVWLCRCLLFILNGVFSSIGGISGVSRLKKYGVLNDLIKKEFETLGGFSRAAGVPKTTLSLLLRGRYGSDEAKVIKRIGERLKELRPGLDLSHIWDPSYSWYQKFLIEKGIVKSGFKIVIDVRMGDEGKLIIAPTVEGY